MLPADMRGFREPYGSWNTIPILRRTRRKSAPLALVMSSPSRSTWPSVASCKRTMARPAVVLPEPLSPTSPSVSPSFTVRRMPSTAFTSPTRRWSIRPLVTGKWTFRSRTSRSGCWPFWEGESCFSAVCAAEVTVLSPARAVSHFPFPSTPSRDPVRLPRAGGLQVRTVQRPSRTCRGRRIPPAGPSGWARRPG